MEEALLYFDLREAPRADMYESLCRLERFLHTFIKLTLVQVFGTEQWWRELPFKIRKECQTKREEDSEPDDAPYSYTQFIDLRNIFEEQWAHLSKNLPGQVRANRKDFLAGLQKLNGIRNRVMHPVREYRPDRADFECVFKFVQDICG